MRQTFSTRHYRWLFTSRCRRPVDFNLPNLAQVKIIIVLPNSFYLFSPISQPILALYCAIEAYYLLRTRMSKSERPEHLVLFLSSHHSNIKAFDTK